MSEIPSFAVMGNPVDHSLSPRIHRLFAGQLGIDLDYRTILVEPGNFTAAVRQFVQGGGRGLNITVPFKLEACDIADQLSARALLAGAVNTLKFEQDGAIFGDNTDGVGLLRDIRENLGTPLHDARLLIIGAGGAVRGVLGPLLHDRPAVLHIANRTAAKAAELVNSFQQYAPCSGGGLDDIPTEEAFDVVINGTAASLQGQRPNLSEKIISGNTLAYDMMYGKEPTVFMQWAARHGAGQVSDGLGMLVEQAAESFYLWHGMSPETRPVIDELRRFLTTA